MPRRPRPPKGRLGSLIQGSIEKIGLTPQETAAAAGISKGTLYKILGGETRAPHYTTLRRLCKILRLDLAEVMGAEQLELLDARMGEVGNLSEMEGVLVEELEGFLASERTRAGQVALLSLMETNLGMGRGPGLNYIDQLTSEDLSSAAVTQLVVTQLREVPRVARPAAVRGALSALLDLRLVQGASASPQRCAPLHRVRNKLWRPSEHVNEKQRRREPRPCVSAPPQGQ